MRILEARGRVSQIGLLVADCSPALLYYYSLPTFDLPELWCYSISCVYVWCVIILFNYLRNKLSGFFVVVVIVVVIGLVHGFNELFNLHGILVCILHGYLLCSYSP